MRTVQSYLSNVAAEDFVERWKLSKQPIRTDLDFAARLCHSIAVLRGWWKDPKGQWAARNVGEIIALIHSELSEALEGARKDLKSDHISGFAMIEEEMADALIRIFDFAHVAGLRLGEAFEAKCHFNLIREDHSHENREQEGGKQF